MSTSHLSNSAEFAVDRFLVEFWTAFYADPTLSISCQSESVQSFEVPTGFFQVMHDATDMVTLDSSLSTTQQRLTSEVLSSVVTVPYDRFLSRHS